MQSPFHAYYTAVKLAGLSGEDRLTAAFASVNIEIFPYQVSAAMFALRSPYLRGCILCDDGSLGKSFEALLIITQRWYEGKRRILIIVPTPLLRQWIAIINSRFSVPLYAIDNNAVWNERIKAGSANPFTQDGVVITTYDFAAERAEYISKITWDLTVFDEAHRLRKIYKGDNKQSALIREAVARSFKLLLTATPMQNDIMDLYGLIYFIDETALPDADNFYKRYFRKPENNAELASRVSKFCFRTMRAQVATYVKIPECIPLTVDYGLTEPEQRLSDMLDAYLTRDNKYAFPQMEQYDLTPMLYHRLSSSSFALQKALRGVERRLEAQCEDKNAEHEVVKEHEHILGMLNLCDAITENAKGTALLSALKTGFARLKQLGAKKKAILFTEYREMQKYLYELLSIDEYEGKVLTFSGDQSRDYTIMERFEHEASILITTDIAAEEFNLEFCSFVINYDLPYNTLKIEQRISRCHRQGQQFDVFVVNLLNRNNFADVRMLELINKRVLQFDGIIGLSDDVIGNLNADKGGGFGKILAEARTKDEIDRTFDEVLIKYEDHNKRLVESAEQSLFTSFSRDIADAVTVSPQYIKQRIQEINDQLWALAKHYFECYNKEHEGSQFAIGEHDKTITAADGELPHLFYYWTGSRNKPYTSQRKYGMDKGFKPASGRITLSSVIGRGVLQEIECADNGVLTVEADIEPCVIGLYRVEVRSGDVAQEYITLTGKTKTGRLLSDDECREIMRLPVVSFSESGRKSARWLRESTGHAPPHELDGHISTGDYINRYLSETGNAVKEEADRLRIRTQDRKNGLERGIDDLRTEVRASEAELQKELTRLEKIKANKRYSAAVKELKQAEENLFMGGVRLDLELEEQIRALTDKAKITVKIKRQFLIKVEGNDV